MACSTAKTGVFWDVEDCPIPEELDPESVYRNIRAALARNGYGGEVSIKAFGDKNQIPDYYESAGINISAEGDKFARIRKMLTDLIFWDMGSNGDLPNLMVISRDGMELASTLQNLKQRNHTILFANPLDAPRKLCGCECTPPWDFAAQVWFWETLAAGGDPIPIPAQTQAHSNDASLSHH